MKRMNRVSMISVKNFINNLRRLENFAKKFENNCLNLVNFVERSIK